MSYGFHDYLMLHMVREEGTGIDCENNMLFHLYMNLELGINFVI